MNRFAAVFAAVVLMSTNIFAQTPWKTYGVDSVTVTATRLDVKYAATRNVSVLTRSDIIQLPAQNITQLMNYALGISMNARGATGIQADPSLRGAGFEQILIMLDGVRMTDPQTGHHNINVPVTLDDIERIEVLRGHGSALYGPDAFGGVINIITRNRADSRYTIDISGGSFGTFNAGGSFTAGSSGLGVHRLSFDSQVSDGYEDFNRQYRMRTAHWKSSFPVSKHKISLSGGVVEKDFGAQGFYTTAGEEYEETRSVYAGVNTISKFSDTFTSTLNLHFKQHKDMWTFFYFDPSIFTANHTTRRSTLEWTGRFTTENTGSFTIGAEGNLVSIESTSLGNHDNERYAFFGEYGQSFSDDFLVNMGIRIDNHSEWGTELNPFLSFGYIVNPNLFLKSSIGRSFRAPTFIELYSPLNSFNEGDPTLEPERAINFDSGTEYQIGSAINGSTTYYRRSQDSTIDWKLVDDHFEAFTFVGVVSQGVEQELNIAPNTVFSFKLGYTYLHQNVDKDDVDSRYLFIYPKHHLSLTPRFAISDKLHFLTAVNWRERTANAPKGVNNSWVLDARISYRFEDFTFTVDGLNLLDEEYQEIRNVPMPGRAIYIRVRFSL